MKSIVLAACLLLQCAGASYADSRDAAINAIANLKQNAATLRNTDELKSIESTFNEAEQYRQKSIPDLSEQYYLLTLQKVRILLTGAATHPATPSAPPAAEVSKVPPTSAIMTPETGNVSESSDKAFQDNVIPSDTDPSEITVERNPESEYPADDIATDNIVGHASIYTVEKKDTLRLVAAKLGVSRQHLVVMNSLGSKAVLKVGQKLKYNNRKIIPSRLANGIIINIPDRTLYYFKNGKLATSLPIAVGVPKKGAKYDWTTPTGKFSVTSKVKDPTWYVPRSIKSKMEEDGKEIITSMPPGPGNPLGRFAIKTSLPGILIHSTTKPGSIYSFASHGCIRVYPEQMERFFNQIKVNTPGEIIYHPVKLAVIEGGRIFLEVHNDAYGKSAGLQTVARQLIEKRKLSNRVDWDKVEAVIAQKAGFAEDITL